ncbi:MAG: phosphoribosylformylglycinamidine synthase [Desulfarculales bacterium]|jgi:phosphoribosylformylglycinamidine synthase|nr:phosphoribosylformylglycinamidine synthase [Desulfarculales bacterium]
MAFRLEIGLKPPITDPGGLRLIKKARDYLGLKIEEARIIRALTFDADLSEEEKDLVRQELFTNPVSEESSWQPLAGRLLPDFDFVLRVGFRPGVRDNEGATACEAMADCLGRPPAENWAVYTSRLYVLKAPRLGRGQIEMLARELLANPIIQQWQVYPAGQWDREQGVGLILPAVKLLRTPQVKTLIVENDEDLLRLSEERGLFLNPADLPVIRAYFARPEVRAERAGVGLSHPTDVELEYISQARSDHCNHNTFTGRFHYFDPEKGTGTEVNNLFKVCVKEPTLNLAGTRPWLVSLLWDNAGVARLDENYNYAITAETHNSPSNIEAYGGAVTGIVGVYRDPMGTGLGAKLAAGIWGFCVAPYDYKGDLLPALHPRRLLDGIVEGVRDGGNKSGIPTVLGSLYFDPRYLGKCLVFVGAVGIMPREVAGRPSHEKTTRPGELIFMCGGRVGADGIHGVTASSAEYSAHTPAGHVQIGDPYTQKKMHDFLLEARDRDLIRFITDNGGGGLSSSVGESARLSPGARVDLAQVPLKYQGLEPWQIWVSESQERMTVAVNPRDEESFLALAKKHAVEATVIGTYSGDGKLRLDYNGRACAYIDVEFLEKGFPQWEFTARWLSPEMRGLREPVITPESDFNAMLLALLDSPNLCGRQWINRQYDHEVQGSSVLKPFAGRDQDIPAEAAVIKPVLESRTGLALAEVMLPDYGDIDTYHMVTASVEEGVRRVTAVGGNPEQVGGMDNFCWPSVLYHPRENPGAPYKAAQLVRAGWGLKDACLALGVPLLSGKDSMYMDGSVRSSHGLGVRVSAPPTMIFTASAPVPDLDLVQTLEPKVAGDLLYILGLTKNEMGGGSLYRLLGQIGRNVPVSDFTLSRRLCRAVSQGLSRGLLASVAVPSRGGLAYALARMVMASALGLDLDLSDLAAEGKLNGMQKLFSESTARFVVSVDPKQAPAWEELLSGLPCCRAGRVVKVKSLTVRNEGDLLLHVRAGALTRAFRRRFGGLI